MRMRERHYRRIRRVAEGVSEFCRSLTYRAHGRHFPPVLVNALPKSGSTYISRTLARTLEVDQRTIAMHGFRSLGSLDMNELERVSRGNCVLHQHLPAEPHVVAALAAKCPKMVLNLRDPRAALVSWGHFVREFHEQHSYLLALQAAEQLLPDRFFEWSHTDQLTWHVDHYFASMISWIEGWLRVADAGPSEITPGILVTEYAELTGDPEGLFRRILDFYGIAIEPEWLSIRRPKPGSWKFRAGTTKDWRVEYTPEAMARATAMVPEAWRRRFGWE